MRDDVISIHAPHEGERHCPLAAVGYGIQFQSTLPTRGSDGRRSRRKGRGSHFNPRSPRGGATGVFVLSSPERMAFQSTLPTRGSDAVVHIKRGFADVFQSTLPTRGSDYAPGAYRLDIINISIHAPHEGERQAHGVGGGGYAEHFNPRSPRGGATASPLVP